MAPQKPTISTLSRVIWALGLLAAIALIIFRFPLSTWLPSFVEWIRDTGPLGQVAFAAAYTVATVFLLPSSVFCVSAGFIYGPVTGVLVMIPTCLVAGTVIFIASRFLFRAWVIQKISNDARLKNLDAAIHDDGKRLVFLLRLSPISPFAVVNYALGATRVKYRDFLLGTLMGMLPGISLYVYTGSLLNDVTQILSGERPHLGMTQQVFYVLGFVATLAVTVVVTRLARKALTKDLEAPSTP